MKWMKQATLSAVGLALLLAGMAPALRAQAVGTPGDSAGGSVGPGDSGQPVGGANSGGGELPKRPSPNHGTNGQPPVLHDAGATETGQRSTSGDPSGSGGEGGTGSGDPGGVLPHRRRQFLHQTGASTGNTADAAARRSTPAAATAPAVATAPAEAPAASITTVVRLVSADGTIVAGALLIASDPTGHVLAVAVTDEHGLAVLRTAASDAARLLLDVAGGVLNGVAVPAGSAVGIVLAH